MQEYGMMLPSDFFPQIRESIIAIKVEGGKAEYELPDINEEASGASIDILMSKGIDGAVNKGSEVNDGVMSKKYNDLLKEM